MNKFARRLLAMLLCICLALSTVSVVAFAEESNADAQLEDVLTTTSEKTTKAGSALYDTDVSKGYFNVISSNTYDLAPGAQEHEIILNNAEGNDRKVVHVFEVDSTNEKIQVVPGYYGIDKLDPNNLPLEGVADKAQFWKAEQLTKTVAYYEDTLGYNVVGAMNTALAYDSNAPYGYMVWNGVVLGTPEVHKGAQTYLAIDKEGNAELRSMSTPLNGSEWTAISANFNWLVKNGKMTSTSVERTSSDASRSMIGIKADGSLVFCQVDGRNAPVSTGLSNYEMGEMMLSLGCVNAVNCDGGGSSTFVSKREGTDENVMRSVPSDGSERPTINSVMIVSTAMPTGVFHHAVLESAYGYIAPGASVEITAAGVDTNGYPMDVPTDVTWKLADEAMGSIEDGIFTAGDTTGTATVQMVYGDEVVGELFLNIVHPESFGFAADSTVIPYGKSVELEVVGSYGVDDWAVCVDGSYELILSDEDAGYLDGSVFYATTDETITGVDVTVIYLPDDTVTDMIKVTFGKGSEILFDFEDGSVDGWMGFVDAKQWSIDNGVNNTLVGSSPLGGQFSEQVGATTFLSSEDMGGKVKNGEYALAWSLDNTDAGFAGWTYNVLFYVGEQIVLRDVANGKNATKLGMWLYIPENAAGLAFQSQLYTDTMSCKQDHFTFTTANGTVKNLNSCTEADIPESRWVYATINLTAYDFLATPNPADVTNSRSPSIVRTYVKPVEPAVITFYIDDITLDYSDAVDDRVLPVVSNVSYTSADESVELIEGAVISGESIAFSAKVSDNAGLNDATAVISVDGNPMLTTVSGGIMACDGVKLNPGVHTVSYEIQDKLGNLGKITRTFCVSGDAVVTLTGHNDSGALPEYDSIYYADINVADIAAIDTLTATVYLQTANTWEPQGITVADGFEAEYSLNEVTNELTVTVKRVGESTLTGAQTLVSMPVRSWSWNGFDSVAGKPVAPETQYATGYCPIVQIRCDVVYGNVTFVDQTNSPFGGAFAVDTMMNDTVNPWHYHDAELTVLSKEATCSENGYENRTYCETCQSVIEWGTMTEATGHNYAVDGDAVTCECGDALNSTGLVQVNGKVYNLIAGKIITGWQNVDGKWCYSDETTKEVQTGEFTVNGITYTADEDGLLVSGTWVEDFIGRRYSYGPAFYTRCFQTIDGEEYYFAEYTGYALTGYQAITENRNDPNAKIRWYHFAEDGKLIERMTMTGVLDTGDGLFYMEEGCVAFAGMVKIGDDYYCVADKKGTVLTGYQWVGSYIMANSKNPMENGYYEFDADGKMLQGVVTKEDGTYYYEMGKPTEAGWVKDGDDYYVFGADGKALTGRNWVSTYMNETSKDPYKVGNFVFSAAGKLANGITELEDGWYYCVDGVGKEANLICVNGVYYYAGVNGKLETGRIWVGTYPSHGLLPKGYYEFGDNGAMLNGVVEKEDGTYYYENGILVDTGWLKVGEDHYVFSNGGKALTGMNWVGSYLTEKSRDPYMSGNFFFDEDGKLASGIVEKEDGYYYYEKGVAKEAGLIYLDCNYYLTEANGKLATGRVWVGTYASNGLLAKGYYEFGENGEMLQGVVAKDNGLYFYDVGNTKYRGLIEHNGEYYYVNDGGKLETGRVWVGSYASNGLVANGYYEFGEDGAMLNGFEKLDGGLYYYNMGRAEYMGLVVIGDDLYYIVEGGKVMTGANVWVGSYVSQESNGLLPVGRYTFDEEGKLVK